MTPKVLKKSKSNPPDSVYIGRPSKFGNPFTIGKDGNRQEVCAKYKNWIMQPEQSKLREEMRNELRGKSLVCFCAPLACHGDTILQIANSNSIKKSINDYTEKMTKSPEIARRALEDEGIYLSNGELSPNYKIRNK